jgi:hypothetical protein
MCAARGLRDQLDEAFAGAVEVEKKLFLNCVNSSTGHSVIS